MTAFIINDMLLISPLTFCLLTFIHCFMPLFYLQLLLWKYITFFPINTKYCCKIYVSTILSWTTTCTCFTNVFLRNHQHDFSSCYVSQQLAMDSVTLWKSALQAHELLDLPFVNMELEFSRLSEFSLKATLAASAHCICYVFFVL